MKIAKRHYLLLFVLLVLIVTKSPAQELPQGCFRNPMNTDIALSASFAEFRANHFHGGIDIRTGGEVNRPVYAAADGYVAKVSISPWGGGKILYIHHPQLGHTTVYMHLNGYAGAIGKAVLKEHYRQQAYTISRLFDPDELPVHQGQLVAYSGNTGGSGGPHLHFEVRRGGAEDLHTHATLYNPLHFSLPYRDGIAPTLRGLRIYPDEGQPFDVGNDDLVNVDGPFYLGIYATDAAEGSTARNGVDHVEVFLDGSLFFMYVTDELPVDSSRMVNAIIDYHHYLATRQAYLLTRGLPGADGPWVPVRQGDGIFRLRPGSIHRIGIRVYDVKGNVAERTIKVQSSESGTRSHPTAKSTKDRYDQPYHAETRLCRVDMPAFTLYADDSMQLSAPAVSPYVTPLHTFRPTLHDLPPHQTYTLSLRPQVPLAVEAARVTVVRIDAGKMTAYKTTCDGEWFTASVRNFGQFTLAIDTVAPTVRPLNFTDGATLKENTLKIKIGDNLSGVEIYNCHLNGEWILAEFDGKTATLVIDTKGKLRTGNNEFTCTVTDGTGNKTQKTWTIVK